jgi:hypothetical protein
LYILFILSVFRSLPALLQFRDFRVFSVAGIT